VAPIVDVRATGDFIDTYVYIVEWGQTKVEVIERGLAEAGNVTSRLSIKWIRPHRAVTSIIMEINIIGNITRNMATPNKPSPLGRAGSNLL
jgi:hypothetical protein